MPKAYAVVTYRLISDPEKLAAHAKLSLPALATMVAFWSPGVLKECQILLQPISMLTELAGRALTILFAATDQGEQLRIFFRQLLLSNFQSALTFFFAAVMR